MFTGIIEALGTVREARGEAPRRLRISSSLDAQGPALGESIAIDGCCLTVVESTPSGTSFEVGAETLRRTTLGSLRVGEAVNLERALRLGDRLGGHLVAGHVDAVGRIERLERDGATVFLTVSAPQEVAGLSAPRGSITLAGVSLTITAVEGASITVALIPHTLGVTTLGALRSGDAVNLEADLLARYVARLLAPRLPAEGRGLTMEFLQDKGFA